jgi:neutral ceramidase
MSCARTSLLDVGQTEPHPWTPDVLPTQIIRVGRLVILGVPGAPHLLSITAAVCFRLLSNLYHMCSYYSAAGEFTTMSGRRLRATVAAALNKYAPGTFANATVVIAGLSNTYSGYITTPEEYGARSFCAHVV